MEPLSLHKSLTSSLIRHTSSLTRHTSSLTRNEREAGIGPSGLVALEVLSAGIGDHLVDVHHDHLLDRVVAEHLASGGSLTSWKHMMGWK